MIRMPVPKEIRKYETKLIGPLTSRQFICLMIASLLTGSICYLLHTKYELNMNLIMTVLIPIGGICGAFASKPYGMKFENYIFNYIIDNFLAPAKRKFSSENYYSKITKPYVEIVYDKKGKPIKPKVEKKKKIKSKYKYIQ